jgi:hypothetical protein
MGNVSLMGISVVANALGLRLTAVEVPHGSPFTKRNLAGAIDGGAPDLTKHSAT